MKDDMIEYLQLIIKYISTCNSQSLSKSSYLEND